MITLRRFVPVSLLAGAVLVLPQAALAHDELISTDPTDGATVEEAPEELTLTFSGEIAQVGAVLTVTDADGTSVAQDEPEVDGVTVVQDLADDLGAGDYEVVWRVTSQDGHPISGTFGFVVATGAADDQADDDATEDAAQDTSDAVTDQDEDDATQDASPEASAETDLTATPDTPNTKDDASTVGEGSGMPVWAWVVAGLGAAGLVGLLARTWSRNRA